jgi:hypothetical protein
VKPPVTTPFWVGQTVYLKHGGRQHGLVLAVIFEGDPAYPLIRYRVSWPKSALTDEYTAVELTAVRPKKKTFTV